MKKIIILLIAIQMSLTSCVSKQQMPDPATRSFQPGSFNQLISGKLSTQSGILVVVRDKTGLENYSKIIFVGYEHHTLIAFDPQQRILAG